MIPVTKPYLPNRDKLNKYIDDIYEREWLTNNGPIVQELTNRLEEYLGVENLLLVSNGTLALQIAYRTLGVHKQINEKPVEAITTPFTFVATASSLKWEGIEPVFTDIHPETWCLDPKSILDGITLQTRAIVPVHVYGNVCDVEAIDDIAKKRNLKVIYDAAHAFGVKYKDQSLLKWGDAATLSFHATKVFHTIEGGAIIFKRKEDLAKAQEMINFGLSSPNSIDSLGINAKLNEFQAAMGLVVLDELETNLKQRRDVWRYYREGLEKSLGHLLSFQNVPDIQNHNAAYFPILLSNEESVLGLLEQAGNRKIGLRRYFYPALSSVKEFGQSKPLAVAEDVSKRVICLPLYAKLKKSEQDEVIDLLLDFLL